ncbi:hypothetical protein BLA29_009692, partial [Euroglyphus maynei]
MEKNRITEQQPIRSESIIQLLSHQQRQQPLFNSVSVIQQAPPSRPPSSTLIVPATNENNSLMDAESEEDENENDDDEDDVNEEQENFEPISYVSNNTFSEQQPSTSKSENINEEHNNKMLVPYNSLINVDEEDIESIEQKTHDGFNYSHVQSAINAHTRYNYSNFYDENYYKYYYLPPNTNNFCDENSSHSNNLQEKSSSNINDDDLINNMLSEYSVQNNYNNNHSHNSRSNQASVELCKVE